MKPFGVDISSYQGANINYDLMKQKTKFVAVRTGISWGFEDPVFAQSWQALKGHNRIAYHVLYPSQDVTRQVNWLFDILSRAGFDAETDRLAIDIELWQDQTPQRVTEATTQMYDQITERTGRKPIIYSAAWFVNPRMVVTPKLAAADWWLANYPPKGSAPGVEHPGPPILPRGITSYLIHQTSETGIGKNVGLPSGAIDTNRWNGTDDDVRAYFGRGHQIGFPIIVNPGEQEPEPPEQPEPLYRAKVKPIAPDRLNVRRTPNGQIVRKINAGDIVGVYQDNAGWSRIGIGEWVMSRYIQRLPDEDLIADGLLDVQLWSQQDIRWGGDRMGSSYITLKQEGCLVTAVSSYLNFLGIDTDPKRYNQLLSTRGGYQTPNKMYWKMPDYLWTGKVERAEYSGWFTYGQGWETLAQSILDSGRPALAHVDFIPGGSVQQHWVLLIGNIDGVWWMYDPIDGTVSALAARYDKVYRIVGYRKIN